MFLLSEFVFMNEWVTMMFASYLTTSQTWWNRFCIFNKFFTIRWNLYIKLWINFFWLWIILWKILNYVINHELNFQSNNARIIKYGCNYLYQLLGWYFIEYMNKIISTAVLKKKKKKEKSYSIGLRGTNGMRGRNFQPL